YPYACLVEKIPLPIDESFQPPSTHLAVKGATAIENVHVGSAISTRYLTVHRKKVIKLRDLILDIAGVPCGPSNGLPEPIYGTANTLIELVSEFGVRSMAHRFAPAEDHSEWYDCSTEEGALATQVALDACDMSVFRFAMADEARYKAALGPKVLQEAYFVPTVAPTTEATHKRLMSKVEKGDGAASPSKKSVTGSLVGMRRATAKGHLQAFKEDREREEARHKQSQERAARDAAVRPNTIRIPPVATGPTSRPKLLNPNAAAEAERRSKVKSRAAAKLAAAPAKAAPAPAASRPKPKPARARPASKATQAAASGSKRPAESDPGSDSEASASKRARV
ncbi:hypothetical protein HWV62_43082, partial [Athelia sp. TMB]